MPVSQWIAYPLHLSYLVFYPLNWLLNSASRAILRLLGVKESSQHEILTDSEIEGLVEESAVHGGIESGEAEYIHNVFRFGDLAVSDVMVHRTAMMMINADLPPDELVREVLATEYTRIPLWRDKPENIIGVLHAKDLLRAIRASDGDTVAASTSAAIALPPWFVPEMRPLSEQLKAFRRRKTHFALVVDEYGEVEGMVTLEDILEEIVGDISDEHDVVVAGVRAAAGRLGRWSTARCRSAISTAPWTGICPTRRRPRSPASSFTKRARSPSAARALPSTASASACCAASATASRRCKIAPVPREAEGEDPKPKRAGTAF